MRFGTSVCSKNSILKSKIEHSLFFFFEQFESIRTKNISAQRPISATIITTITTIEIAEVIPTDTPKQSSEQVSNQQLLNQNK